MIKFWLLALSLTGIILFFPINIADTFTCLGHKYLVESVPDRETAAENLSGDNHAGMIKHPDKRQMVDEYIFPFALLWWISIAVFTIQFHYMKKKNSRTIDENENSKQAN